MDKETLREMLTPQMVLRIAATLIRENQGAQQSAANKPTVQPSSSPAPAPATSATGVNLAASYGPGGPVQPEPATGVNLAATYGPGSPVQPTATTPAAQPSMASATFGPGVRGPDGLIIYGLAGQTPTTGETSGDDRIEKLERELAEIKGQMSTLIGLLQGGAS